MFDRFEDVTDLLDRQLLTRTDPPSFAHAKELLRRKGIVAREVHWTDRDSIGYLDADSAPWTAWCQRAANGLVYVQRERGFAATPGYIETHDEPTEGHGSRTSVYDWDSGEWVDLDDFDPA